MPEFNLEDHPLPDWAVGFNDARQLDVGAQLLTKDGRRTGNARIEAIIQNDPIVYLVRTDIGNTLMPNAHEIAELYYVGPYFIKNQREHNGWTDNPADLG